MIDGSRGRELGREREARVYDAVMDLKLYHRWIFDVRKATARQDRAGIDLVVTTDSGKLYLQVKSNKNTVRKWRKKHGRSGNNYIGAVVCNDEISESELNRVLSGLLTELRDRRVLDNEVKRSKKALRISRSLANAAFLPD